uniref:Uncharacterized protein n=1 Tax=Rhizophora mucronata TaxID=61149 RepID=A0A2P2IGY5_RHIMU
MWSLHEQNFHHNYVWYAHQPKQFLINHTIGMGKLPPNEPVSCPLQNCLLHSLYLQNLNMMYYFWSANKKNMHMILCTHFFLCVCVSAINFFFGLSHSSLSLFTQRQ